MNPLDSLRRKDSPFEVKEDLIPGESKHYVQVMAPFYKSFPAAH